MRIDLYDRKDLEGGLNAQAVQLVQFVSRSEHLIVPKNHLSTLTGSALMLSGIGPSDCSIDEFLQVGEEKRKAGCMGSLVDPRARGDS